MGFGELWISQRVVNVKSTLAMLKQRIFDQAQQDILNDISISSKCYIYKHVVSQVKLQFYLHKSIPLMYKKYITKLRLSSIDLEIERGRYSNLDRNERKCKICRTEIEDEFHFLFICPIYADLRKTLLKPYYIDRPSMFKLIQLLSSENYKEQLNLGKYIFRAYSLRKTLIIT